jgi:WD40 repeat protein
LFAGSWGKTIKLWNLESVKEVNSLQRHGKTILSITFSTDGKYMASSSTDNMLKLWSVEAQKQIKSLKGHTDSITFIAFSPDNYYLASGS